MGRFINTDGSLGQTGELLGHNLFSNDARPELGKRPTYEADPSKSRYEIHQIDNEYNMPYIKWRDWSNGKDNGADGHIFWDN